MGAAAAALAAFEVAVAGARRPLAGRQLVGVHRQAHRAARLAPVGAGGAEHAGRSPSASACAFTAWLPGTTITRLAVTCAAVEHRRGGAQVLDAAVRARADEHRVDGDVADRRAGVEAHVLERPGDGLARRSASAKSSGDGTTPSIGGDLAGVGAPRDVGRERRPRRCTTSLVPRRARRRCAACASRRRAAPTRRPSARGRGPRGTRTSCRRGRSARPCAPASIDMLHTVIRPSIDSARIAEPRYSMTWPMPAAGADLADDREDDVLGGDAGGQLAVDRRPPSTSGGSGAASGWRARARPRSCRCRRRARRTRRGWRCGCRRTRSSCPGSVRPCSGPMTWTMPWPGSPIGKLVMPNSAVFAAQHVDLAGRDRVGDRLVDVARSARCGPRWRR